MGFRMKITGGAEDIVFDERSIMKVDFNSASSVDSNARATDFGLTVKVWGKMLYKLGGEGSSRSIYFYWKRGRYFSKAMKEFLVTVQPAAEA